VNIKREVESGDIAKANGSRSTPMPTVLNGERGVT
jgi:hypothetical protein